MQTMMKFVTPDLTASLSERVMLVLHHAHDTAKQLGNSHVAVEHLLLGLVMVEGEKVSFFKRQNPHRNSLAAQVLRDYGLQKRRIEDIIRRQNVNFAHRRDPNQSLELAQDARQALRLASSETAWIDQTALDTSHLLLGLMLEPKACAVARSLRLNVRKLRERLRQGLVTPSGALRSRNRSRYTPAAQIALSHAQSAAKDLQHSELGTEHLLMGLLRERNGVAGRVLKNLGVQLDAFRARVEQLHPPEPRQEIMGLSTSYKRLLDRAGDEMRNRQHHLIGTGHLLFHLLRFTDDVSIRALRRLNIKPLDVYQEMRNYVSLKPSLFEGVSTHFENPLIEFTATAQELLRMALEEAERLEHHQVETGHILMGLLMLNDASIKAVLQHYGFNRRRVRALIELMTPRDYQFSLKPMQLSEDVQQLLTDASSIACEHCEYPQINPLHLFWALLHHPSSSAATILHHLEIDRAAVQHDISKRLSLS